MTRACASADHAPFYAIWFSWIGSINSAQATKVYISAPSKSLSWFPVHLAREKGFYSAEGLDVDYVIMKPQVAMQALIAGDVGYTTALGSTIRAALRNVPLRVVMTIADKPLFALIARPGIASVDERKTNRHYLSERAPIPTRALCCAATS
jgi:ABC-type nitrate/sulfonate/bicarbonate transport system substrate-binding protein